MKVKALILFFVLFALLGVSCSQKSDFVTNWKGTITHYIGTSNNVIIPTLINNTSITIIDNYFAISKGIISVVIPDSITYIGQNAFENNHLTSVVIPDSVTYIGQNAFFQNNLSFVKISNTLTFIEDGPLLPREEIYSGVFANNNLVTIDLPDTILKIGIGAFANNKLTSIIIPNSVTTIGEGAFINNNLDSIIIPSSVTYIGEGAFENNRLTSILIPDSVTTIDKHAFSKNNLTSITIGGNVNILDAISPTPAGSVSWSTFNEDGSIIPPVIDNYVLFREFYNNSGKKSGTYIFDNNLWKMRLN